MTYHNNMPEYIYNITIVFATKTNYKSTDTMLLALLASYNPLKQPKQASHAKLLNFQYVGNVN